MYSVYTSEGFDATFSLPLTGTELVLQSCGLVLGPDNSPWDLFLRSHRGLCEKMQVETVGRISSPLYIHCTTTYTHVGSLLHHNVLHMYMYIQMFQEVGRLGT